MRQATDTQNAVRRGIRRGCRQIVRDRGWGTTLLLLTMLLLLMQIFSVLLLGLEGGNRLLTGRAALHLEIRPDASESDMQELYAALRQQPSVRSVTFVTRAEALRREQLRDPELIAFLEEYDLDNPFPDTLSVLLVSLDAYDDFHSFIRQDRWQDVINPAYLSSVTGQERSVRTLLQVTGAVRMLVTLFIGAGFVLLCFVIIEWVMRSMTRRRREIELEHALGAPPLSIIIPPVTEMSALLLLSGVLSMLITGALLASVPLLVPAMASEEPFTAFTAEAVPLLWQVLPLLFAAELLLLPLLAFAGTVLGVRATFGRSFAVPA